MSNFIAEIIQFVTTGISFLVVILASYLLYLERFFIIPLGALFLNLHWVLFLANFLQTIAGVISIISHVDPWSNFIADILSKTVVLSGYVGLMFVVYYTIQSASKASGSFSTEKNLKIIFGCCFAILFMSLIVAFIFQLYYNMAKFVIIFVSCSAFVLSLLILSLLYYSDLLDSKILEASSNLRCLSEGTKSGARLEETPTYASFKSFIRYCIAGMIVGLVVAIFIIYSSISSNDSYWNYDNAACLCDSLFTSIICNLLSLLGLKYSWKIPDSFVIPLHTSSNNLAETDPFSHISKIETTPQEELNLNIASP